VELNNQTFRQKHILELLTAHKTLSIGEITDRIPNTSRSTITRDLESLEEAGSIVVTGAGRTTAYQLTDQQRQSAQTPPPQPKLDHVLDIAQTQLQDEDPLIQVRITNPLAYLKKLLLELLKNEGLKVRFSFELKPLTVIGITLVIFTAGLGLKTLTLIFKYTPLYPYVRHILTEPDQSRVTGFDGVVLIDEEDILLVRSGSESVLLQTQEDLHHLHQKRVYAKGRYNPETNKLQVDLIYPLETVNSLPIQPEITSDQVQTWVDQLSQSLAKPDNTASHSDQLAR